MRIRRLIPALLVAAAMNAAAAGQTANFGYETAFGSLGHAAAIQEATQVTLSEAGTLQSITARCGGTNGKKVRFAIYSDSGGEPGALLAETTSQDPGTSVVWFTLATPEVVLAAGTYWLAIASNHSNMEHAYDPVGGQSRKNGHGAQWLGFSATWGVSTSSDTRKISIYATCIPMPQFDVSAATGFDVMTTTSANAGSGMHWADLDDDGDLDVLITGNSAKKLTSNSEGASFTAAVFGGGALPGQGGLLDVDNDGDLDFRGTTNVIWTNDGSGAFSSAGALGFDDPTAATTESIAAGDLDGDGWCDLLAFDAGANWIAHHGRSDPTDFAGTADASWGFNDAGDFGDGEFCASADVNGDGYLDYFYLYGAGRLFMSDGDGTYTESAGGISVTAGSADRVGAAWADYDNDGDLDLFVPRYDAGSRGYLWRNDGGSFTDVTVAAGVTDISGQRSACWGDYLNDGDLDLYIVTHSGSANIFYSNDGDGTFTEVEVGIEASGDGHDAVFVDYDNDGDLDLALTQVNSGNVLLLNTTDDTSYLKVRALGAGAWATNTAAIGTRIDLYESDGTTFMARRDVGVARGFGGTEPLWAHFGGVDPATSYVVRVHFLSGAVDTAVTPSSASTTIGATTIPQMLTVQEAAPTLEVSAWEEIEP